MSRHRGKRSFSTVIAAVVVLLSLATALVFVLLLRPATGEYNNTIPAVMGILTMISAAVPAMLALLKAEQNESHLKIASSKADDVAVTMNRLEDGLIGRKVAVALAVHDDLMEAKDAGK